MAPRKISDYMTEVREFFPQIDPGECQDRVWRAVLDLAHEENFAFLVADPPAKIITEAVYATGTVTITGGVNATLTGGAVDPAWTNRRVILAGRGESYGVTLVDPTHFTLDSTFLGTTTADLTYRMFRDRYSLPSDCEFGKEFVVFDVAANREMDFLDYEKFTYDRQTWRSSTSGIPTRIARAGLDSNGVPQLVFDPAPGSARVYNVSYYRTPARPASIDVGLTPPWPDAFHDVIPLRAVWEWADRKAHPRRLELLRRYQNRMRKMRSKFDGANELRRMLRDDGLRGEITLYGGTYSK